MPFVPPRDRVLEKSTTNSQAIFNVTGAPDTSYNAFSAVMSVGDTTIGGVIERGVAFKSGILTYSGTNQVIVTTTLDFHGTFSASGVKEVFMGLPSAKILLADNVRGYVNRLRNTSLSSWFRGSGNLTGTGFWAADGIWITSTGASVTAARSANGLASPQTFWSQKITGNTSVTDAAARFVVDSLDAAPLAGQQVTFQIPVLNNTGGTITPTITVKHAGAQEDFSSPVTDVSAVSLQPITNGSTGVLAYSWTAHANSFNGLSVTIDFGNNFSSNAKSVQIGGGFDLRVTPNAITGLVSAPPTPEIRTNAEDILWCQEFFKTSYDNGTAPGTATRNGLVQAGSFYSAGASAANACGFGYGITMRRAPSSQTFYDGAGTASAASSYNGSWVDGSATSLATLTVGASAITFTHNKGVGGSGTSCYVHYAVSCEITGA